MRNAVSILFHAVGLARHRWSYPWISDSLAGFRSKMEALEQRGYDSLFFKDHDPRTGYRHKTVVLTFDDGYLDNWVHVVPLLRRHGLRATIFVNPEFVDPRPLVRPQVEPAQPDAEHEASGCCAGFMSWEELRRAEAEGLVDVQSHCLTHDWYFRGPRIVDFWRPGSATMPGGPIWMLWNAFPDIKPHYLSRAEELETRIPYGTPIYEHGKALETRRYRPADGLEQALPAFVEEHGGPGLFDQSGWRDRLLAAAKRLVAPDDSGNLESERDYMTRVRRELTESREILERELGKRIEAVCWPGGGVTDDVLGAAREAGYRRFTRPSGWRSHPVPPRYEDLTPRLGAGLRLAYRGRDLGQATTREFVWAIERAFGSTRHRLLLRSMIALRLLRSYLPP